MTFALAPTRRQFLQQIAASAASITAAPIIGAGFQDVIKPVSERYEVLASTDFARIEKVGDGLYAVISTPLDADGKLTHRDTLCNGGVIETDNGLIAFDAYLRPEGARWVAQTLRDITGKPVTHVIISHLHLDHSGGIAGFLQSGDDPLPEIIMTQLTFELMQQNYYRLRKQKDSPFERPIGRLIVPTQVITNESTSIPMDVDGRRFVIEPLAGHTPSDLAVRMLDAPVTFAGDLMWWGLFPNYRDAIPSALEPSVAALTQKPGQLIVTGHGGMEMAENFGPYKDLLASVRLAAQRGLKAGVTAEEAARAYSLPPSAQGWGLFSPRYPEVAIASWYREAQTAAKAQSQGTD